MPNWCSNNIEIRGEKQELDRLGAFLATGEQDFDFNLIAPYPDKYRILDEEYDKAEETGVVWEKLPKSGYEKGGYDWCITNWGTKWNPEVSSVGRTSDTIMTAWFETAWSPAIPIIQKLSELFPTLEIKIEFEEEGLDFSGYKIFKGGEVISEEDFEDTEEDEEDVDYASLGVAESHVHLLDCFKSLGFKVSFGMPIGYMNELGQLNLQVEKEDTHYVWFLSPPSDKDWETAVLILINVDESLEEFQQGVSWLDTLGSYRHYIVNGRQEIYKAIITDGDRIRILQYASIKANSGRVIYENLNLKIISCPLELGKVLSEFKIYGE